MHQFKVGDPVTRIYCGGQYNAVVVRVHRCSISIRKVGQSESVLIRDTNLLLAGHKECI